MKMKRKMMKIMMLMAWELTMKMTALWMTQNVKDGNELKIESELKCQLAGRRSLR